MQVSVQKSTSTTRPRKSGASSGSELSQAFAPVSDGMCSRSNTLTSVAPAEQLKHEQEDVEDVEEDAGRDRDGASRVGAAQPVEVEDRVAAEDDKPQHRVDQICVRDRDEDRHDAEGD